MSNVHPPHKQGATSPGYGSSPAQPRDHLSDHEYDGIREYDNPTPGWWHVFFLATVLFSALYIVYMHGNENAPNPFTHLTRMQTQQDERDFGSLKNLVPTQERLVELMQNTQAMSVASARFATHCTSCHAKDGGGSNGVNLTDDHYKNVKTILDIYNVITNGAASGSMPSWKAQLSERERVVVAAYVAKLRGTKAASPKAPEGEVIPAWPTNAK